MAPRIKKALVKRAADLTEPLFQGAKGKGTQLLTAAAVLGLAELAGNYQWIQSPPPHTALDRVEGAVMLVFRPGTELHLEDCSEAGAQRAAHLLTGLEKVEREALQCLALKALEGNLTWGAEPTFPALEKASRP